MEIWNHTRKSRSYGERSRTKGFDDSYNHRSRGNPQSLDVDSYRGNDSAIDWNDFSNSQHLHGMRETDGFSDEWEN